MSSFSWEQCHTDLQNILTRLTMLFDLAAPADNPIFMHMWAEESLEAVDSIRNIMRQCFDEFTARPDIGKITPVLNVYKELHELMSLY